MMKKITILSMLFLTMLNLNSFSQPVFIKNVPENSYGAFNALGNYYFFHNDSLWKSDGTTTGTNVVRDLGSKPAPYETVKTYILNSSFYFKTVIDGTHRLWVSDGTYAGTIIVGRYAGLEILGVFNNELYYSASQSGVWKLFKVSTGSPEVIKNIHATEAKIAGSTIFLRVAASATNTLWKTNGTTAGTALLKNISPVNMQTLNDNLLFSSGSTLWKSNGTSEGTVIVREFLDGWISSMSVFKDKLYFARPDYSEMYISDGTANGTTILKENIGVDVSVFNFGVVNDQLYFNVDQQGPPTDLWRSDGTTAGTYKVHDMPGYVDPSDMTVSGNRLFYANHSREDYYSVEDFETYQLWQSDLTGFNTKLVQDIFPGTSFPFTKNIENVNDVLFFMSKNGSQTSLWKYNPNAPATSIPYFSVVNANTEKDRNLLKKGDIISITGGQPINIRFNSVVNPASVKFFLNGSTYMVDSEAPFALAGDNAGDYNVWPASQGNYTLIAKQYSGINGGGTLLASDTINFSVYIINTPQVPIVNAGTNQSIAFPTNSVTLSGTASDPDGSITSVLWTSISGPIPFVDVTNPHSLNAQVNNINIPGTYWFRLAATDNTGHTSYDEVAVEFTGISVSGFALANFDNGTGRTVIGTSDEYTLDLATFAYPYWNAFATTEGNVGSVKFTYGSTVRIENDAPFTLFGDNNGELNIGTFTPGTYTINAIPYSGINATGTAGLPHTLQLTVINSAARMADSFEQPVIADCYPNPTSDFVNIKMSAVHGGEALLEIYDMTGILQEKIYEGNVESGQPLEFSWDASQSTPGVYVLVARIGDQKQVRKLIVK
ncbi:MAG: T9SS type A sorting domain-containing protein [Sporocytophaga sp.]|uniref:PKD domain-containing protein n=1 Tax=Sporocytophaga sp. TaxID=2231183 RepID=UPI001B26F371|nr:T9SS type A sorting domain-containing protein [Sporocytophaga sp.]MBO9702347.1 T9SS type A sorting domain-containing protein [Sporocytophaga sp.]